MGKGHTGLDTRHGLRFLVPPPSSQLEAIEKRLLDMRRQIQDDLAVATRISTATRPWTRYRSSGGSGRVGISRRVSRSRRSPSEPRLSAAHIVDMAQVP